GLKLNKKTKILISLLVLQILQINTGATTGDNASIVKFSENRLLSSSDFPYTHHVEPTIAISGNGTIFTGWKEAYTHNGGGVRVSFSKSVDNGLSWSDPFNMPNFIPDTGQSDPWLVWYEETESLYYAYLEFSLNSPLGEGLSQITVAKSSDYGETWTLATATYGDGFADKETMTVSNDGILYVAYDDINMTSGATYVRLTRSDDGGSSFEEIKLITDSVTYPVDHLAPYVTTDSNNSVFIAWLWFTDAIWGDIYVTSSMNQGLNFTSPVDINQNDENSTFETSPDGRPAKGSIPVIHFDQNDRLFILWAEKFEVDGLWDIYLRYSDDYGLSWGQRYQVNPSTTGNQWEPDMEIDSQGILHVTYYDDEGGTSFKPFYRQVEFSQIGEPIFNPPIDISNGVSTANAFTRPGDYFTIRVDSYDTPHVVWSDGRNSEMDIYYAHGVKSTETEPIILSTTLNTTTRNTSSGLSILAPLVIVLLIKNRKKCNSFEK
ncbi:MAG: sialidase family protein, partial [Candidatus Hodarchaeales archaeon]